MMNSSVFIMAAASQVRRIKGGGSPSGGEGGRDWSDVALMAIALALLSFLIWIACDTVSSIRRVNAKNEANFQEWVDLDRENDGKVTVAKVRPTAEKYRSFIAEVKGVADGRSKMADDQCDWLQIPDEGERFSLRITDQRRVELRRTP